jgi:2-phospho-L-lactate guanylyltransferase
MNIWAILPVKSLSQSKSRLSRVLSPAERAALTQHLLAQTIQTLQQVPAISDILVVSRDETVLALARHAHTRTFTESEPNLKTAVTQATKYATLQGADQILIIPADLPFLQAHEIQNLLNKAASEKTSIISPDQTNTGTNALILPPLTNFKFQYGIDSYHKHLIEADRLHIAMQTIRSPGISFDLDTEADWHNYQQLLGVKP